MRAVKGTSVYIDDILVTGSSVQEHLQNLDTVLDRLESAGLRVNRKKSFFLQARIEYLGYIIDKDGLHPTEEKVTAIKKAPPSKNITELRSFLGLISYYGKFLPSLAHKLTNTTWQRTKNVFGHLNNNRHFRLPKMHFRRKRYWFILIVPNI